jgi:citrate lyase beta subunit
VTPGSVLDGVRSLLFVPATEARKLERAWQGSADAVIVDLEDAVAEEAKVAARATLASHLMAHGRPPGRLIVRINALDTLYAEEDLSFIRSTPAVDAVLVPKAATSSLGFLRSCPPVIALVETAAGVLEAREIASSPGVGSLMIGTIDLAADLGVEITAGGQELLYARSALVLASAATQLPPPIDGVWPAIDDEAGLRAEAAHARALGFGAKACIHPAQVWAHRVLHAYEEATARGEGAIALDGRMIDRPVVLRARRLLDEHDA